MAKKKTFRITISFLGLGLVLYPQDENYLKSLGLRKAYADCLDLFQSLVLTEKNNIEIQNLSIFMDTMFEESALQKPLYLKTFAYESLTSVKGFNAEDMQTKIADEDIVIKNLQSKIEHYEIGKPIEPITKEYVLGMLDREEKETPIFYYCENKVQICYAILLHCLENRIKIKRCSDCNRYFTQKTNSSRCAMCKHINEKKKLEEIKSTLSIKLYQKMLTHLNARLDFANGESNKDRFLKEYKRLKGKDEILRLKELIRMNEEYVHWKPDKSSTKSLMNKVHKAIEEGEKNGK